MHDLVAARAGSRALTAVDESVDHEGFSTSHTPSRSGPAPAFICAITEASWLIFRSRSGGVQPLMSLPIARSTLSVRRPSATASSSSKRFSRFHQAM